MSERSPAIIWRQSTSLPPMSVSSNSGKLDAVEKSVDSSIASFHILVVDKDYELSQSIKSALSSHGCKVTTAHDGNAAIAIAEVKKPDLIVLDLQMPKRSGLLVMEHLAVAQEEPIPIIVVTANEGSRHRKYAQLFGAIDYIIKPFTMDRLIQSVENILTA